ncbi:MAG: pseudaminic acid cytidylyltransferase, partial [Candidatus Magasanikbacteria bacterium]|nr:pseudaminic acid cytidylyltransferase [Candidatus Magasanikbacteria bacterium]
VILEVLQEYKKLGKEFEYVCCLYATAPFVTVEKLQLALKTLKDSNADTVFPVVKFSSAIQRALKVEDNLVKMIWPENISKRSQDLEPTYHDCGQFYFLKTDKFLKNKKLFSTKSIPLITAEMEVQDIDNEADWKIAELKYKILNEKLAV